MDVERESTEIPTSGAVTSRLPDVRGIILLVSLVGIGYMIERREEERSRVLRMIL